METTREIPLIGPKKLKSCVRGEFKLILVFVTHIDKLGFTCSEVNPFAQALNDCVTLKI